MTADPCQPHSVVGADGARLDGCAHGGHLTGWWPAGAQQSRLWMSARSTCGPEAAIRGGIPVVFPQFGALGALRKHGFARTRDWRRCDAAVTGDAVLQFGTDIDDQPGWPHHASLTLTATATGGALTVALDVTNAGTTAFPFTAALHTYLAISSSAAADIDGTGGCAARDATANGRPLTLAQGRLPALGPMDLMIDRATGPLTLHDPADAPLQIDAEGFGGWVVWNPGPAHGLTDVADGDETGFVCVEPALLTPATLAAGQQWSASVTMAAPPNA
jgi:glucose-6-phosphate 1-epimerase